MNTTLNDQPIQYDDETGLPIHPETGELLQDF